MYKLQVILFFSCIFLSTQAHPAIRGKLAFQDGNILTGELQEENPGSNVFHADRFGMMNFNSDEATFIPDQETAASQTTHPLIPDNWNIGGSYTRKSKEDSDESEVEMELRSDWINPRDNVRTTLRSKYKIKDGDVDNNEQEARIRWFHDLERPWFTMVNSYLEKDEVELLNTDQDYLLWQNGAGAGIRLFPESGRMHRLALVYNHFDIDLTDLDISASIDAPTLYMENQFQITPRLILNQWLSWYFWEDGDEGIDSEMEFRYSVTENFSLGLRHRYRDSAGTLQTQHENELKLFTALSF